MTRGLAPIVRVDFDPKALEPLQKRALSELEGVQGIELHTEEDAQLAAGVLVSLAAVKKDAQAQSKEWLAPLKAETERIRAPFKKIEDLCDEARALVDKALGRFHSARAAEVRRLQAEATKAVIADDVPALTQAMQAQARSAPVLTKGVTVKEVWVATVTDPAAVPREFLQPDPKKIGAHASACRPNETPAPIPGVVFNLEASTTVRTKGLLG